MQCSLLKNAVLCVDVLTINKGC